jgi:hypothetical protein
MALPAKEDSTILLNGIILCVEKELIINNYQF